jgi:hypothetical protein
MQSIPRFSIVLVLSLVVSCGQENKNAESKLIPFEYTVYDSDFSMAITHQYVLTENTIKIINKAELEGEKDSVLFEANIQSAPALIELSRLNIDSLKKQYKNSGVSDGTQIKIIFKKEDHIKITWVSNFYQPDVGRLIEVINGLVPKRYKIWYDKEQLLKYGAGDDNVAEDSEQDVITEENKIRKEQGLPERK